MISVSSKTYKRIDRLRREISRCEKAALRAERNGDFVKLGQIKLRENELRDELDDTGSD